eukprot:9499434-Pyramimonas_sp.AAC.1
MASEGSLLFIERYTKAFQGLLSKSDGRDKLLAAMQYAAMFTSAGAPGVAQQVQKSLAGARKPFRVMKVGPASERPYELHSGRPFASQALSACHAFRGRIACVCMRVTAHRLADYECSYTSFSLRKCVCRSTQTECTNATNIMFRRDDREGFDTWPIDSIMPLLMGPAKKGTFPVLLLDK